MTVAFCFLAVAVFFNLAAGYRAWLYIRQLEGEVWTLRGVLTEAERVQCLD
jgi:hypothetical protein